VRVSIGTSEENDEFLVQLKDILGKGHFIVTVDGPAGVGKSTLAKKLAKHLGIAYLDTGAMYRSLGLRVGAGIADLSDGKMQEEFSKYAFSLKKEADQYVLYCNDEKIGDEIRTEKASRLASIMGKLPEARKALQKFQREIGKNISLVAEGRDMGTVVFPHASVKFFLDARPEVRAKRRYDELLQKGQTEKYEDILQNIIARDEQDRNRAVDPLKPHETAIIVDTSDLDIDGVFQTLLRHCPAK
jgi:cytidylate kinase